MLTVNSLFQRHRRFAVYSVGLWVCSWP